jgi:hypothetical protein
LDFGAFTSLKWWCWIGRPITMMRAVALTLLAVTSGCAMLATGTTRHHSGGTACVESPIPATIDFVLGLALVAAAATGEASAGVYVLPGAFVASGTLGAISAARCNHESSPQMVAPLSNSAPSFGNAEVDPAAETITAIEQVTSAPPPRLRLGPDYQIGPGPQPTTDPNPGDAPKPAKLSCGDAPGSCPKGQTCGIAGGDAGYCVPEPSR